MTVTTNRTSQEEAALTNFEEIVAALIDTDKSSTIISDAVTRDTHPQFLLFIQLIQLITQTVLVQLVV